MIENVRSDILVSAEVTFFICISPVKVEMKGPHDYSSPADWPLMMVCMINPREGL